MKAVGKYIVISTNEETTTQTKGGLILDEKNREDLRYREAEVVNAGDLVNVIKEKDKIYYDRHAGFGVEVQNKHYTVIKEQDVVIVL